MMTSETSIISRLPAISGRKLSSPCDEGGVAVGPGDDLAGAQMGQALLVEGEQLVVHPVAEVVLDADADQAAAVAP